MQSNGITQASTDPISLQRLALSATSFQGEVRRTRQLCADLPSFFQLSLDLVLYRLLRVTRLRQRNQERSIRTRSGATLRYRLNRGDIWTVNEVWMQQCYRLPEWLQPSVVLDLGANIGLTSLWLVSHCRSKEVLMVEPVPANAELARRNLEGSGCNVEVIRAAVGPFDGETEFREYGSSVFSEALFSSDKRPTETDRAAASPTGKPGKPEFWSDCQVYSVPVISMPSLIDRLPGGRANLVKMDIEGAEQELLTGNTDWLASVDALTIEFHPPRANVSELVSVLDNAGFKLAQSHPVHLFVRH